MGKYATFEEELDAIRDAMYEETKHMTTAEHVAYFRARGEAIRKEYNIKRSDLKPLEPIKPFPQQRKC
ncbi:MAG: hypothetical protein IJS28_03470 [Synergistaceae bacterium]|nr:hypothetical protein [Synergistaceae bacterium]